ncbi:unnamed protein product, partial [Polarella glacialis]
MESSASSDAWTDDAGNDGLNPQKLWESVVVIQMHIANAAERPIAVAFGAANPVDPFQIALDDSQAEFWVFEMLLNAGPYLEPPSAGNAALTLSGLGNGFLPQDFGPKANFKGKKIKVPETWDGFPRCASDLLGQILERSPTLEGFDAAECLSLWYDLDRGASHALHVDDVWLWGERIIGVTLQSPSVFTFYHPGTQVAVRVPLGRRSAYLISGRARFDWQHGILAEDIVGPRIAMTFRELTPELAETDMGQLVLQRAKGCAVPPEVGGDHEPTDGSSDGKVV